MACTRYEIDPSHLALGLPGILPYPLGGTKYHVNAQTVVIDYSIFSLWHEAVGFVSTLKYVLLTAPQVELVGL